MIKSAWIDRHFSVLFWGCFLLGLALTLLFANNQILTGDQTQMLFKGYLGARSGEWLNFGNAASAVGNVPGSLSAYIVGLPLLLWDSPWAPMGLLIGLHALAYLMFDAVVKRSFDQKVRLVLMLIYWLSPWLMFENLLYNPSYLFFAAALHLWTAFELRSRPSFRYTLLHILAIGFAMQLHYSWPVLAVVSTLLFYRKLIHISWLGLLSGFALILASLIPYLLEYQDNPSLSRESDRYIGYGAVHVYPVVKAVLYWLRYGSLLFSKKLIGGAEFDWLTDSEMIRNMVRYSWQALLYSVGAATLILSARINYQAWHKIKGRLRRPAGRSTVSSTVCSTVCSTETAEHWLLLYAFAALIGILIAAALSPITFSYWHLIIALPAALLPLLAKAQEWLATRSPRRELLLLGLFGYLLIVNLVAAHDSQKYSYATSYSEQVEHYLQQQESIPVRVQQGTQKSGHLAQ
ncbi:MAG: hypothetical protein ACJAWL_000560 [Motiliproteus sp.]|jgi:hypothetical protein